MKDYRQTLINQITSDLTGKVEDAQLHIFLDALTIRLADYELAEKCTALVPHDDESTQIVKLFLATKKLEGRSEKTLKNYALHIRKMLESVQKPVKEITLFDLRSYLAMKQATGCSARSVGAIRSVICGFFKWAYSEGMIPMNPSQNLGVIKFKKEIKRPFTKVDLELIRSACTRTRDRAIVETLLSTGCRISELVGIDLNDVDFQTREIKVLGKGNKERIVYLDDVTVLWLQRYLAERKEQGEFLFAASGRGRITDDAIRAMLNKISSITGVDHVHPHRFRRTLATMLIERGMSLQEVAKILGHDNINTTMTYVFLDDEKTKAAYNKYAA